MVRQKETEKEALVYDNIYGQMSAWLYVSHFESN